MKNTFTIILSILYLSIQAQVFTNYTTDDGLINNTVNCLAVDADDNLWFGTQEGISFFDGTNWTNYDVDSYPDLVSNTITAIAVDSENKLWVGTDFGLNSFDGNTWETYTEDNGLADNRVKYIAEGPDGKTWVANSDGLSIFDGTDWVSYTMNEGIPFGGTNFITFNSDGKAWLGSPLFGVLIFDGNEFSTITEADGLLSDKVRSIAISDDGYKWIGTADGISVFDPNNEFAVHHEYIFELPPPDELNPVEDVQIDSKGRIWVGVYVDYLVTEGGISIFDGFGWQDYDVNEGLIGPVIRRLDVDSQDNVWVATSTGVSKVSELPTSTFNEETNRELNIFPVPAKDHLNITIPVELLGKSFQVFNSSGILVKDGFINNTTIQLNLNSQPRGTYFLSIDKTYSRKFILK